MKRTLQHRKGVFALLLALSLGMGTAYAYTFSAVCSGKTLYFNVTDATNHYVEITCPGADSWNGFTQPTGNITLPSSVTHNGVTYTVTKIGNYAFHSCNGLTGSLTIPNSVTTIAANAFMNCSGFTSITALPDMPPTLGTNVFHNVPTSIPVYLLCASLEDYQSASGWSNFTNMQTFDYDPLTYSINPDGVSVTVTGHVDGVYATGELTIPSTKTIDGVTYSVTAIGYRAFFNCNSLTGSLTIPNSVTSIGPQAFQGCIGFNGSLTFGTGVTSIGMGAFYGCTHFTGSLTIPDSVTEIQNSTFWNCSGFTGSLIIPNSVTSIGATAFQQCTGFTGSLTLGTGVTSIDDGAFYRCTGFTSITALSETPPTLGTSVFYNVPTTIPVYVPCVSLEAYQNYNNTSEPWGGFTNFHPLTCDGFPYVDDFETACDWELINGNLTNKWAWGEASVRSNHHLYISDNNGTSNHYTITSPTMVYAAKQFHFEEGWYRFQYDWLANGEKNYDYLRVALVPASVTLSAGTSLPSGFSYQSLPSGWIALDGGHQLSKNAWWQTTFSEIYVPTGDYRMVFAWRNDTSIGTQPPAAIDNVSIRPVTCLAPVELTTRHVGASRVYLDWTPVGNENEWEVWLSWYNGNETEYWPYPATTHPFTINGLTAGRTYTATVNAICGPDNASFSSNEISFTTSTDPCDNPATFPFTENFDGYEGATSGSVNVLPDCWSRINTTTVSSQQGYPTITEYSYAQSAPNFLYFMSSYIVGSYEDPQDQYAILPPMDHMANLELSLSARIPAQGRNGTFMVGVMTDPTDASTFTEIATLQPTSTTYTQYTVPLDLYTGDGWYIAIKMPAASSSVNYRGLCIDDVTVNYDPLTYAINADGVSVTVTGHKDGTNASGELIIPETKTIDGVTYTVTAIGDHAFSNCEGLTGSLTIPNTVTTIGDWAFGWCTSLSGSLILGNSLTTIGNCAFNQCEGLTGSLTIPNTVTTIGYWAFSWCTSLSGSLILGNSVTAIGDNAFYHCSSLTGSLTIPNSVTAIGEYAFASCVSLTGSLILGNSLTSIGFGAFQSCYGFTGSLTIPNSVTTIGGNAFYPGSGFTSLSLGNSVTEIGRWAFFGCMGLTTVTVLATMPPMLGEDVFTSVPRDIPVYVPCASLADYQAASGWSRFTNMQCIPETLTVYDGTASNDYVPVYGYYADAYLKAEFVMPAAELATMTGGDIVNMKFYALYPASEAWTSTFSVFMKEVDDTAIDAFSGTDGATVVYEGLLNGTGSDMTIHFSTPYHYNGGNLLVGVYNITTGNYESVKWIGVTVAGASVQGYSYSSLAAVSPTQRNFIPKTTFGYTSSDCSSPTDLNETDITFNSAKLHWTRFEEDGELRYRKKPFFYEDFADGLPSGWTTIDNDGDGYNWHSMINNGSTYMASASYNGTILTPDNWLVTPQLELQGTMKVWIRALHPNYAQEHFAIYLSTTGTNVSDFTTVLVPETTLNNADYHTYAADLSAYEGQQGYIAIRHFNCSDMYELMLDYFGLFDNLTDTGEIGEWNTLYEVVSGYTLTALEPETEYEWQVRGFNCDGNGSYTEWSSIHSFVTTPFNLCPPEDQCELTFTLTDSYGDGWNGAAILVVDVETDIVLASMANENLDGAYVEETQILTLAVCDGRELRFEWYSGGWDGECSYTVTDANGNEIFSGIGTMSDPVTYMVDCTQQYIFLTDGNWNNGSCWNTGSVPPAGSDVIIQANVTVPAGYLAVANEVNLDGGSITVADGGQLKHNTMDLVVTMKKNIAGYDDANSQNNYYLLAVPFLSVQVPTAMTANPGSDFYRFDPSETGAEWRNHKEEPITFVQRRYGYLYANPESVELSLTGITLSVSNEFTMNYTVDYTEGSSNPSNGWALLGNPFTYNAYVYRFDSNNEFVPMPIMMYDEEGELQTIYGGPVAPMQGFFVHVTETTTVYFSGTAHLNDYVDLGLPSGLLWATCNVGANAPEEYGDYFAWGETTPKDTYDWSTYQYGDGSTFTKYTGSEGLTTLLPEDDAATANWGSGWRMPTNEEWQELYNNTTMTWTQQNGVNGKLFTAVNGNSLFLPAAGGRWDDELDDVGDYGNYWSSSLDTGHPYDAWIFGFYMDYFFDMASQVRFIGYTVRPVREN